MPMSRNPNPINLQAIDHVVLRARDAPRMIDFYCDVLGCRLERTIDHLGLFQLRAGASLIDIVDANGPLGEKAGGPPSAAGANMDHFCLLVVPWSEDDIVAHLDAAGVAVGEIGTRYGALGPGPSLYIQDPEGNTVELKGG